MISSPIMSNLYRVPASGRRMGALNHSPIREPPAKQNNDPSKKRDPTDANANRRTAFLHWARNNETPKDVLKQKGGELERNPETHTTYMKTKHKDKTNGKSKEKKKTKSRKRKRLTLLNKTPKKQNSAKT